MLLDGTVISEAAEGGTVIGMLSAIDPDGADGHTYQIVGGDDRFTITDGKLMLAPGATLDHVVKTTAYLSDIRDYPAVNEVRNRVFAGREPASTMVEVTKFVHPAAKIEIDAVAIRPR